MYDFRNETKKAQKALKECLLLEPRNLEFLYTEIEFLLKQKQEKEAVIITKKILEYYPDLPDKKDLLNFIETYK